VTTCCQDALFGITIKLPAAENSIKNKSLVTSAYLELQTLASFSNARLVNFKWTRDGGCKEAQ
jgi:hypothetical protein